MIKTQVTFYGKTYFANLAHPIDISMPIHPGGAKAWYVEPMRITPVMTDRFIGSVAQGGDVNFRDIWFNPHGHGTHTECVGHITEELHSINQVLKQFFFLARLITVRPKLYSGEDRPHIKQGDLVIDEVDFSALDKGSETIDALVIRSMPNGLEKKSRNYSNANAPFFSPEAITHLRKLGIKHLLTDLPSVDREEDGGSLLAHRAFWYSGFEDDAGCTITEFIYVPDQVTDGLYLLNLQVAPFENDASPSKPVLYALQPA